MKQILTLTITMLLLAACCSQGKNSTAPEPQESTGDSVISMLVKSFEDDSLTDEEAAHWDSMNNVGEYMLVRGAERDLDTIVNHIHLVFIKEE